MGSLAARSCAAWPLLAHPQVLQLCDAVLGKQRLLMTEEQLRTSLAKQYPVRTRQQTWLQQQQPQQQPYSQGQGQAQTQTQTQQATKYVELSKKAAAAAAPALASSTAPQCFPYQLHLNVTIPKQPGSVAQVLHRDGDLSLLDFAALGTVDHAVSCIWALDGDFTEMRGTTRVSLLMFSACLRCMYMSI